MLRAGAWCCVCGFACCYTVFGRVLRSQPGCTKQTRITPSINTGKHTHTRQRETFFYAWPSAAIHDDGIAIQQSVVRTTKNLTAKTQVRWAYRSAWRRYRSETDISSTSLLLRIQYSTEGATTIIVRSNTQYTTRTHGTSSWRQNKQYSKHFILLL